MAPNCSKFLQIALNGSKWLQMAPDGSRWLQMAGNGWKWLQMAQNGSKRLHLNQKSSKWFQIVPKSSKWLQMAPNICPFVTLAGLLNVLEIWKPVLDIFYNQGIYLQDKSWGSLLRRQFTVWQMHLKNILLATTIFKNQFLPAFSYIKISTLIFNYTQMKMTYLSWPPPNMNSIGGRGR